MMTANMRSVMLERTKELGPPLLLFVLFVATGLRGRDFGHHWDEVEWQLKPVRQMAETGLLVPHPSRTRA